MKVISTSQAPAAIGPYSQAIHVGNLIYTSGQLPLNPATGAFPEGGIKAQTRQSLTNVKAILEAAGTDKPFPARSAVAVKTLPKGALVEIEAVAEAV